MSASLNLSVQQAQQWLSQAQAVGDTATVVQRVHTDSRTLQPGDLFVALKGERFDALSVACRRPDCLACKCPTVGWPWANWPQAGADSSTCPWWR